MVVSRSILASLVALALSVFPTVADDRPTPEEVASACIAQIAEAADATVAATHRAAQTAIERIETLDADGASDEAILRAGRAGERAIENRATTGVQRVNTLVRRCVAALRALDADASLIAEVRAAGEAGRSRILGAANNSKAAVQAAVSAALG